MMGGSECDISEIVEINMTPVSSDVLPIVAPGPWIPSGADSTNFWVAQLYYNGFWWWNGTPFSVCNSNVSVWAVGSANSVLLGHMGCQSLPLP